MTTVLVAGPDGELRTDCLPGESWAAAAARLAGDQAPLLQPVDLSGPDRRFAVCPDWRVQLRRATTGDLGDLVRWRQQPHVARWWHADGEPTAERVHAQYLPEIEGGTPTTLSIIEVNGRSIGFLQDYPLAAYPEYALLTPEPDAIGLDYAIGQAEWTGRGFGVMALWAWVAECRRRFPQAPSAFAAPDHRNRASLRMLAKAGFVEGTWFDDPDGSTVVGCSLSLPQAR
ncbi:hypothetical protein GCM10009668_38160 [Nocardioides dubius]|uniref:N-acetyltransferase domain-containing protein n=1 Tax=Nocardioides dubius TaxID=317019 RepID=A0ABN1U1K6_9ACTN